MASSFAQDGDHAQAAVLVSVLSGLVLSIPQASRAQLHSTGFSYSITTNGLTQRQQLKQNGSGVSAQQFTSSNLDLTDPTQYKRLNPAIPDFDLLQQQTLNNQRTESRSNTMIMSDNFTFSVFRSNQFQPPN